MSALSKDNAKQRVYQENNVKQEKHAEVEFVSLDAQEMKTVLVKMYVIKEIAEILARLEKLVAPTLYVLRKINEKYAIARMVSLEFQLLPKVVFEFQIDAQPINLVHQVTNA